jgi:hypothetical protein
MTLMGLKSRVGQVGRSTRRFLSAHLRRPSPWTGLALCLALASVAVWAGAPIPAVGVVFALVFGVLGPRLQEYWRRRPSLLLSLEAGNPGKPPTTLTHTAARPWPIAIDEIVGYELAQAEATVGQSK